jgi:hypothetical protein
VRHETGEEAMALFTDGSITTVEELVEYESAILDVAKTERIDLTAKLKLAQEELGVELDARLRRRQESEDAVWAAIVPRGLGHVVVTEALHKWHTFRSLSLAYRDAYNRQLNDRFLGKWQEYDRMADWARQSLFSGGLGMTSSPVRRAAQPELGTVAGQAAAATYFVRVTWVAPGGIEGAPSAIKALTTAGASALTVTAVEPPAIASGWNVYASYSPSGLTRQNDAPIAPGETWTEPAAGLAKGKPVACGQRPEMFLQLTGILNRG